MPMSVTVATARLAREVPEAEARLDDALLSLCNLMATMVQARRDADTPANTGQAALLRLAKAQTSILDAGSDVLRVHGELLKIGQATGALDLYEECKKVAVLDPINEDIRRAA
jgi:hypothetical protein